MPVGLYVDRDSIYRTEREATVAEQLAGQESIMSEYFRLVSASTNPMRSVFKLMFKE